MNGIIGLATPTDCARIGAIYAPYVLETTISFETEPPNEQEMRQRVHDTLEFFAAACLYIRRLGCGLRSRRQVSNARSVPMIAVGFGLRRFRSTSFWCPTWLVNVFVQNFGAAKVLKSVRRNHTAK